MVEQINQTADIVASSNVTTTTTSSSDDNAVLVVVEKPRSIDVLCGRGKICFDHKGNDGFRELIAKYADPYQKASTKKAKMQVILNVVNIVTAKGGRFLVKNKEEVDQPWVDGGVKQGKKKTGHALRDALRGRVKCITRKMMMGKELKENTLNHPFHTPPRQHHYIPPSSTSSAVVTPPYNNHRRHPQYQSHQITPNQVRSRLMPISCVSGKVSNVSSSYNSISGSRGGYSQSFYPPIGSMKSRFLPPPSSLQPRLEPEREWRNSMIDNDVAEELANFFVNY